MLSIDFDGSMSPTMDANASLSEVELCHLAAVKRARRQQWARQGLVRHAGRGARYATYDVVETTLFARLVRELEFELAALAWDAMREDLPTVLRGRKVLALIDMTARTGTLVGSRREAGTHLVERHPTVLLDLTPFAEEAQRNCQRITASRVRRRPRSA